MRAAFFRLLTFALTGILLSAFAPVVRGVSLTTLYSFPGGDSQQPMGELVADDAGNFYGTTRGHPYQAKHGTIFKITPDGQITTIHTFTGGADGKNPTAGLVRGRDGNFYGTAYGDMGGQPSYGSIFRLTPKGEFTTLHTFNGGDGWGPGPLMQASDGNLYGTTAIKADGTLFRVTPSGQFTNIHTFKKSGEEGTKPRGVLVEGENGILYGTTEFVRGGYGTVFRVTPTGVLTTLHIFNYADGSTLKVGLTKGPDAFYGTTSDGGGTPQHRVKGTVFRITASGELKTLHLFQPNTRDGFEPEARLLRANDGSFYGTTMWGGAESENSGAIFRVAPDGTCSVVYSFHGRDGSHPCSGLIQTPEGAFYGLTTQGGTANAGTFYKLTISDSATGTSAAPDTTPATQPTPVVTKPPP
jgi:uncharacterized repeat protein (TIGR03803 family)